VYDSEFIPTFQKHTLRPKRQDKLVLYGAITPISTVCAACTLEASKSHFYVPVMSFMKFFRKRMGLQVCALISVYLLLFFFSSHLDQRLLVVAVKRNSELAHHELCF
jgi:hypothetical protein